MVDTDVALLARRRQNRRLVILLPVFILMAPLGVAVGVLAADEGAHETP